jgi:ZIP family zinc transporter/zinc and cadmium transporter
MKGVLFAALAGVADLVGGLVVLSPRAGTRRTLDLLVGFGAGFMLAVALVEMTPKAVQLEYGFIAILAGYLIVHFTQHALTPHFHFGEETHKEAMVSRGIGIWALAGLIPHSFFDGVAIGGGFMDSEALGMLVFTAILLHKVPTGVSLASVMLASGNSRRDAVMALLVLGVVTVAGALVTPMVAALAVYGLALAAGVTLYVAASNLIPESLHRRSGIVQAGILAGVLAFFFARLLLNAPN